MLVRILIPIVILAAGFGAMKWLGTPVEEPRPERQPPRKLKTGKLEITLTDYPVILQSQGTVRAHHTTTVTPLVAGTISVIHPCFEDGAFFNEGDILAELDPADLQAQVIAAESRLAQAEATLAQEEARAKQAKLNWEDIGYDEDPSPLVLRVPQLKEARARVTSALADLDQAQRNLDRAKIRAPFDGRVKTRAVGLGQAVGATTSLGEVFATDYAEVRLPLAPSQLPFVELPAGPDDPPVCVTLQDALRGNMKNEPRQTWKARIVRTEGALDETSRELFAIARIDDPFGRESGNPELRIGQPVRAAIQGVVLKDVFVIPRSAMRGINRIYRIDRPDLSIRRTTIDPVFSNSDVLVLRDGLDAGDWVATSRMPYTPDGAPVEIIEADVMADSPESRDAEQGSGS
jgi:RND family efflux transporter MFP subunit